MSLALNGERVLFIFLGTVNDWGKLASIDAVMDIQNRQHFAAINENILTVTAQELQSFYCQNTWNGNFWSPNILTMLEFYLKNHPSANSRHIFIDEAPIIQNRLCLALHMASSLPFKSNNLWITLSFCLIYLSMWVINGTPWTILLPPIIFLLLLIAIIGGILPSSFSPNGTARQMNSLSNILPNTILWIALHTRYFGDRTIGVSNIITKSEVDTFKNKINLQFNIPKLRHNMRNSYFIFDKCSKMGNYGNSSSLFNKQIEFAKPPPSIRCLNTTLPIKLELASYENQLEDAVAYAYRKLLKVEKGQEDKCMVILMEDGRDLAKGTRGLHIA